VTASAALAASLPGTARLDAGGCLQIPGYAAADLCRQWAATILDNRRIWFKRRSGYTYGHGWYLDIECGLMDQYHAQAQRSNDLLARTLPRFLAHLTGFASCLVGPEGETGLPTRARRENLGLYWCDAGVHIMGGDPERDYPGGGPHADYEGLSPYVPAMFDHGTRAYSAILSIATPASGIGLDVWTRRRYTAGEWPHGVRSEAGGFTTPDVSLAYQAGTITGIDSFLYHDLQKGGYSEEHPWRIVGIIHFLYRSQPYPHWEHWF
jgi:hypothetical protein